MSQLTSELRLIRLERRVDRIERQLNIEPEGAPQQPMTPHTTPRGAPGAPIPDERGYASVEDSRAAAPPQKPPPLPWQAPVQRPTAEAPTPPRAPRPPKH